MRCKPGDLAIVLKAVTNPAAVGKTVDVVEIAPRNPEPIPEWRTR